MVIRGFRRTRERRTNPDAAEHTAGVASGPGGRGAQARRAIMRQGVILARCALPRPSLTIVGWSWVSYWAFVAVRRMSQDQRSCGVSGGVESDTVP